MNRHSLVVRLGKTDRAKITFFQRDSRIIEVDFLEKDGRLTYGLGAFLDELSTLGLQPSETSIELAMLAAAVMACDTRINREKNAQDSWTREIDVYFPVFDTKVWNTASRRVEEMLHFLTGDYWRLIPRQRSEKAERLSRQAEGLRFREYTCVSLFSGGLDSFIGAIDLLSGEQRPLLISHYWENLLRHRQNELFRALRSRFPKGVFDWASARIGFPTNLVNVNEEESSQRGRSFLFFSLAALAASALNRPTQIYIPENGFISLNIPLHTLRLGALSTRTTHPFYMEHWRGVLKTLGIEASLINPYRFKTKGEMVRDCTDSNFLRIEASRTISCSSINKKRYVGLSPKQCGYCVPCIIRQAALLKGFGRDTTRYHKRLRPGLILNPKSPEGEHVRSFQIANERLRKDPGLASIWVFLTGPLMTRIPKEIEQYIAVYRNGMREVAKLLANIDSTLR